MGHDIFAFCLRRSGHTAIMNWIASQVQPSHSLKDCNMSNGKLTTPVIHIIENNILSSQIFRSTKENPNSGLVYETKEQRKQYLGHYNLLLSSFEDSNSINFATNSIRNIVARYSLVDKPKIVIVMRDPFNLFASRIWRNRENLEIPHNSRATDWFNMQLRQFETEGDFIFIDYYHWVSRKTYREFICRVLDIPFTTDKFFEKQANISSFNNFDGKAVKLGFHSRYEQFMAIANDKQKQEYLTLLKKIDMDLCCRYFMHIDCRDTYNEIKGLI